MTKLHILAIEFAVLYIVAVHYMSRVTQIVAAIQNAMAFIGE